MARYCKKCGRELSSRISGKYCHNCQKENNKTKIAVGVGASIFSAIFIWIRNKFFKKETNSDNE